MRRFGSYKVIKALEFGGPIVRHSVAEDSVDRYALIILRA